MKHVRLFVFNLKKFQKSLKNGFICMIEMFIQLQIQGIKHTSIFTFKMRGWIVS